VFIFAAKAAPGYGTWRKTSFAPINIIGARIKTADNPGLNGKN